MQADQAAVDAILPAQAVLLTQARYAGRPVMLASLGVIVLVPLGLLVARLLGFSPTTQTYTALETIAANLCWVPPLVGWLAEKHGGRAGRGPRS